MTQTHDEALQTVITELTTLAPRLTERYRGNVQECIGLLRNQLGATGGSPITLLTYDAEAGMAYLYLRQPPTPDSVAHTLVLRGYADAPFEARKDYDADHNPVGVEFEAHDTAQALSRASYLLGNA